MAWVRIHDGAMLNLKVTALSDSAFRLWVRGLCYCQTALTDGLIPRTALKEMGARRRDVEQLSTPQVEGRAPLWEPHAVGFKVHDYLAWNDCRDKVVERQSEAKARKEAWKARKKAERAQNAFRTRREHDSGNAQPNQTKPNQYSDTEHPSRSDGRSKRPIFTGQRLTVFEWQLDNLAQILGPYTESFDLHDWFFALDQQMARQNQVIPKRDGGAWLESQLLSECLKRGLPVAQPERFGRQTTRLAAALASIKGAGV